MQLVNSNNQLYTGTRNYNNDKYPNYNNIKYRE